MACKIIKISNDIRQLEVIRHKLEQVGQSWDLPPRIVGNLNLVLEEIVSNIIFYGYTDKNQHFIRIRLEKAEGAIRLAVVDDASAFNPLEAEAPDLQSEVEKREIGGLGIHLVKTLMDEVSYERKNRRNILSMVKKIGINP